MAELPPGVTEENGQLIRYVTRTSGDGELWQQRRVVATTIEEARLHRHDFYHPELGWILEGFKLEKDRPADDIMADGTQSVPAPIEQQDKTKKEATSNA